MLNINVPSKIKQLKIEQFNDKMFSSVEWDYERQKYIV